MNQEDPGLEPDPDFATTDHFARKAKQGDPASFDHMYRRLAPALLSWARLRAQPGMDPEDLMQEVWIRACSLFPDYDPEKVRFRPWLFSIGKFVALEQLRRAAKIRKNQVEPSQLVGESDFLSQCPEEITSFTHRLAKNEIVRQFVSYCLQMPQEDRQILIHCGLEGMSTEDAATRLDLPLAVLRKRWQRIRERVRQQPRMAPLIESLYPD